nr:hypothetical protein [Tanacetum cinerariifolium]
MVFLWLQSLAVVTICYYTKRDWDIPSSVVVGSLAMDGPSTISAAGDFTGSGGGNSGTNVCASGLKHVTTAVAVPSSIIALKQYLFVVVMSLALGFFLFVRNNIVIDGTVGFLPIIWCRLWPMVVAL